MAEEYKAAVHDCLLLKSTCQRAERNEMGNIHFGFKISINFTVPE